MKEKKKHKFLSVVSIDLKEILLNRRKAKALEQDKKDIESLKKLEKELNKTEE